MKRLREIFKDYNFTKDVDVDSQVEKVLEEIDEMLEAIAPIIRKGDYTEQIEALRANDEIADVICSLVNLSTILQNKFEISTEEIERVWKEKMVDRREKYKHYLID